MLLLPFLWLTNSALGQKIGYIDSEYILSRMPESKQADAEMERFASRWSKEVADRQTELDRLERAFKAEEPLLTDEMKTQRRRAITEKERESQEFANKVFGFQGLYFQKRKELMKSLLDDVYKALEKVTRQRRIDFIWDKASDGVALVYTNPVHDYSDYVLEELGIDPKNNPNNQPQPSTPQTAKKPKQ